jgi:diguanylate cyclase (GGDEF)-like protein
VHLDSRQLDLLFGTFFEITSLLHAGREDEDIFSRVLDCACNLLEADHCLLLLAHDGKLLRYSKANSAPEMKREALPENPKLLAWLEKERQPFVSGPGSWHPPAVNEILKRGDSSLVCAPLVAKESHLGLLFAVRTGEPRGFDPGHLKILTALANQTAITIENADLYERLKHEAVTDGLTGVYNYKTLMQTLRTELRRGQRYGHPVTFVMADVDYLKRYNDRFGHIAGSEVLAQVAHLLASNCRNTDIVGKYGGDEFAIILPQTSIHGAMTVAERMRIAIAEKKFDNVERGEITCSFGIANFPDDGLEPHDLVCAADQMLFQAKREGKNTLRATRHPAPANAPPPATVPPAPEPSRTCAGAAVRRLDRGASARAWSRHDPLPALQAMC